MLTWSSVTPWIIQSLDALDCTATDLARRAGIQPSTILRPLNNKDLLGSPNLTTLTKLVAVSPVPFPFPLLPAGVPVAPKPTSQIIDLSGETIVVEIRIKRARPVDRPMGMEIAKRGGGSV